MYEVTLNPGKFAVLAGPLVDSFSLTLDDVHHTRPLVDAIVIQVNMFPILNEFATKKSLNVCCL